MESFWLAFLQLFFTFNAFGIMSLFMSFTAEIEPARVRRILLQSLLTAALVALAFLILGVAVLRVMGITVPDFMVAGGVLLLAFSLRDLIAGEAAMNRIDLDSLGAVPIGVPLITGPAVLTTSILVMDQYSFVIAALAIVANIVVVGLVFHSARRIQGLLGASGAKIIAKLSSLLLAAIGVMMVHKGVAAIIAGTR
jgi:multiple antibiotic resistance protein